MKMIPKLLLSAALVASGFPARSDEAPVKTEALKITQGTNGETFLTLEVTTQKRLGLESANPLPLQWQPEIKAFGRALDPAPLLDLLADLGRAQITCDTAQQEWERAKQLKQDQNISQRAFQDSEAAYRQSLATLKTARIKIENGWGKRIAQMADKKNIPTGGSEKPGMDLDQLAGGGGLIRIDLPAGERISGSPVARLVPLALREQPIPVSFFDVLPVMDAQMQQQGLLFINDDLNTGDRLIPGEAVTAFVKSSAAPVSGVVIPASAVLRHEGKGWVFVQTGETSFSRREIPLDRPVTGGFFSAEVAATSRIVVTGAQTLLSAELSDGGFNSGQRD